MSIESFNNFVQNFQKEAGYRAPLGFGICRVEISEPDNKVLVAHFPVLNWQNENLGSFAVLATAATKAKPVYKSANEEIYELNTEFLNEAFARFEPFVLESIADSQKHRNIQVVLALKEQIAGKRKDGKRIAYRFCVLFGDTPCESVETSYMKLLALSLGKAPLRSLNLDGIFGQLTNVAWSGNTPYSLAWLRKHEIPLRLSGEFPTIDFVDKFPRYLMQVIPQVDNIRLLDTAKTRFGAYLGSGGYTQMPGASYVNFNAGAMGACMNEGRISSSVVVGEGTDVGGGASILGVLSGGNTEPISIGKNCLLGVNSATGISLGDGCIVDGGIAVLAGTVFAITEQEAAKIAEANPGFQINASGLYKGRELSGKHGIHFRQNAKTGTMIAFRSNRKIELNANLH